jgi:hypothetical protein
MAVIKIIDSNNFT